MKKDNKYLLLAKEKCILKQDNDILLCLSEDDFGKLNLNVSEKIFHGISDENKETSYSLYTVILEECPDTLPDSLVIIDKDKLFEEALYPWERLFIQGMLSGRKDIHLISTYRDGKLVTAYEEVHFPKPVAFFRHLHTINTHRRYVRKHCFKVGLYWQGLIHDLSKYSPSEFWVGVKYYQGTRSPNVAERCTIGYSTAWMHHKGRNKHHHEYWTDYDAETGNPIEFMEMPKRYFVESIMDRIAACKVYRGKSYTDSSALDYLLSRDSESHMNKKNLAEMIRLLTYLSEKGEKEFFRYLKYDYLKKDL